MGVISQAIKEKTWRKNAWKTMQNMKMNKCKKGLTNEWIWHMPMDKKMTNKSPKEKWRLKNKGNKGHKK
jgi:hypothetical protein